MSYYDSKSLAALDKRRLAELLAHFGLTPGRARPDVPIPGSPERCLGRVVVEDSKGSLWVLEHLFQDQPLRRERIGRILDALEGAGLAGLPVYRKADGGFAMDEQGGAWQMAPFIDGDALPRPAFIEHEERGTALAAFLCAMREASVEAMPHAVPVMALPEYIDGLLAAVRRNRPSIMPVLNQVRDGLAELYSQWDTIPQTLCHGDFHPLNVIWTGKAVAGVIDWEFTGMGPDLYDAANLLGCVGSEDPQALVRGLCAGFVRQLWTGGLLRKDNARWLYPLLLGLRFAWLSEWLRRADEEMLEMETHYMRIILNSRKPLERAWGVA